MRGLRIPAAGGLRTLGIVLAYTWTVSAAAQPIGINEAPTTIDAPAAFSFAVIGTASGDADRSTSTLLRAVDASPSRFVVHFDLSAPSDTSCSHAARERRRALLDASGKPVVPVLAAVEWAACGNATGDPLERLERIGDSFFSTDESLGQTRMPWLRQSAFARFHRYRENLRWQVGRVLFATINLPDNNNNFRIAAGRNGEFEERLVANRAWLERTFRLAAERRLAGIVLFVDAAPRFSAPMRVPDARTRERDGYYEWKRAFRDFVLAFKGQVLLVQARYAPGPPGPPDLDHPLQNPAGKAIANFTRIALKDSGAMSWLRIDVDAADVRIFRVTAERVFDDPSGELYGAGRGPQTRP